MVELTHSQHDAPRGKPPIGIIIFTRRGSDWASHGLLVLFFFPKVGSLEGLMPWIRQRSESDRSMPGHSALSQFRRCLNSTSVSVERPSCYRAMLDLSDVGQKTRKDWVGLYRRPGVVLRFCLTLRRLHSHHRCGD